PRGSPEARPPGSQGESPLIPSAGFSLGVLMKRTVQTNKGNVTGTRKPHKTPSMSAPRGHVRPRRVRRIMRALKSSKALWPKWVVMHPQMAALLQRGGFWGELG